MSVPNPVLESQLSKVQQKFGQSVKGNFKTGPIYVNFSPTTYEISFQRLEHDAVKPSIKQNEKPFNEFPYLQNWKNAFQLIHLVDQIKVYEDYYQNFQQFKVTPDQVKLFLSKCPIGTLQDSSQRLNFIKTMPVIQNAQKLNQTYGTMYQDFKNRSQITVLQSQLQRSLSDYETQRLRYNSLNEKLKAVDPKQKKIEEIQTQLNKSQREFDDMKKNFIQLIDQNQGIQNLRTKSAEIWKLKLILQKLNS